MKALIDRIDREILDDNDCTILYWQCKVFITPNWLLKVGNSTLEVVSVDDASLLESRVHSERYCGEQVEIVTLVVESRSTLRQFHIQLLQSQFEKFQRVFVDVVQRYREEEVHNC